jgi:hypothetical protein
MTTEPETVALPSEQRVCLGLLKPGMKFFPVAYHNHAPEQEHSDATCPIRTYASPLTVDPRWQDATLIRDPQDLVARITAGLPADGVLVMLPVGVACEVWGFDYSRFARPES